MLSDRSVTMAAGQRIARALDMDVGRKEMRTARERATDHLISYVDLTLDNGDKHSLPVTNIRHTLPHCISACAAFRREFELAMRQGGGGRRDPWRLVLYLDEATPGNILRLENKRKVLLFYVGFLEMGAFLRSEHAWLPLALIRVTTLKKVAGGTSAVVRALLQAIFLGPHSVSDAGVAVPREDGATTILHIAFQRLLGDEAAVRAALDVKGASGLKLCIHCKNVVLPDRGSNASLQRFDHSGYLVDITCADAARLDAMGDAEVWAAFDSMQTQKERGLAKSRLQDLEKACGINCNAHGVLADLELRGHLKPCSSSTRDPMHVLYSSGVVNVEVYLLLKALSDDVPVFSWQMLWDFADADWHWASSHNSHRNSIRDCFTRQRRQASLNDETFKADATELLGVCVLLNFFLDEMVPADSVVAQRASFQCLYGIVKLTQASKQELRCSLDGLAAIDREVGRFMLLHVAAYGRAYVKPKHHFLLHVTQQARQDRFWLDVFVQERKHRVVKSCMESMSRSDSLEKSTMQRLWQVVIAEMNDAFATKLVDPVKDADLHGERVLISNSMRNRGVHVSKGDVVIVGNRALLAHACLIARGEMALLAEPLDIAGPQVDGASSSQWRRNEGAFLLHSPEGAKVAPAWFAKSGGHVLTVLA